MRTRSFTRFMIICCRLERVEHRNHTKQSVLIDYEIYTPIMNELGVG